jgi:hypothetical protein
MSQRCLLSRIKNGLALRTEFVEGYCEQPVVGRCFFIVGEAINPEADGRLVRTSIVQRIDPDGPDGCYFTTERSTYHLLLLEPAEVN